LSLPIGGVFADGKVSSCVSVSKRNTKGKKHGWWIPLHQEISEALKQYIPTLKDTSKDAFLFPSPVNQGRHIHRAHFHEVLKNTASKVGVPTKRLATHSLRKTFAKKMYEALDKDIVKLCYLMRHESIEDTMRYLDTNTNGIWEAIKNAK